jgi:predicted dehydrogenase
VSKVRWGLLSTASINRALIPAIRASQRGELVAVASRQYAKAIAYAQQGDIPRAFGSYQEMLDSGAVDAVYVSVPNHLHAEWSIKAMRAGLHVLCEKPFAITLDEVDAMIAASSATGRVLAEAFMYRHHPQTRIAGEWAHSGRLGEVTLVRGAFDFHLAEHERGPNNFNVRCTPEQGGGCLWDVGVYPLSFAQFIFGGPPTWVFGSHWIGATGVDELFAGQMGYAPRGTSDGDRDSIAQISSSFRTPLHTFMEIIGTEGRLHLNRPFIGMDAGRAMILHPREGDPQEITVPEQELYSGEVEDMHAAILDGKPNYVTLEETRNHIKTVLALHRSARIGQPVAVDGIALRND